jgi:hypothetical protein
MPKSLEVVLWVVGINWVVPFVVSMLYVLVMLALREITYEGLILWRGFLPALRFRIQPKRGWLVRAWERWYGQALFMVIIHTDKVGESDDQYVEMIIVHEVRHIQQQWVLGLMQWILYALHSAYLAACTKKDPYKKNWFEVDAKRAAIRWWLGGRPKRFDLGQRY